MQTPAEERADDRDEDQAEPLAGPIVFDHHLARRRRALRPALVHLVSLVMMLGGLALLVLYQERCAAQVVRAIGLVAQPPPPPAAPSPRAPDRAR